MSDEVIDESGAPLDARQQRLVAEHQHVAMRAVSVCSRRPSGTLGRDDLRQVAQLGLIRAARTFRSEDGVPFAGFSWRHCLGAIWKEGMRDDRQASIAQAVTDHMSDQRRQGSVMTDTPESAVAELREHTMQAMLAFTVVAACAPRPETPEDELIEAESRRTIREGAAKLADKLRDVVERHYLEERDLRQVATELGIDYSTARRHRDAALAILRRSLGRTGG